MNMLEEKIVKIKIYFTGAMIVLGLFMTGGVLWLRGQNFATVPKITGELAYWRYELELAGGNRSLLARAIDALNPPLVYNNEATPAQAVPVLVYHGLTKEPEKSSDDPEFLTLSIDQFKKHLFALSRAGYQTITLEELDQFLSGEIILTGRPILITFDDGRTDALRLADPVLRAVDYTAVMFTISKHLPEARDGYYASRVTLADLAQSGRWEIAAHSHDGHESRLISPTGAEGHFLANRLWLTEEDRFETLEEFTDRIRNDFKLNQKLISEIVGQPVQAFAFPFGDFGQHHTNYRPAHQAVKSEALNYFRLLFYQDAPGVRFRANYAPLPSENQSQGHYVRRVDVHQKWSADDLLYVLATAAPKALPYHDYFNIDRGWISAWGGLKISGHDLTIRAEMPQTGAAAVLDGTRHWVDYEVTAKVESPEQNGAFIWVRFLDDDNNAACNFGQGFAHAEQVVNGTKRVIKGERGPQLGLPAGEFEIRARVYGRTLECYLDGELLVSSQFLDPKLAAGGIGVKTWDRENTDTTLIVKEITVSPPADQLNIFPTELVQAID